VKKLLIAKDLKHLLLTAMKFLHRSEIMLVTAETNDEILQSHLTENAHLIVTKLDTPGMSCEKLVHTIRKHEHMRKVAIILLCDGTPADQARCNQGGVNAVMTQPVDHVLFAHKVQELLDIAPRSVFRVSIKIAIAGEYKDHPLVCSAQNISTSGMLIKTAARLAKGERIACSFFLPHWKHLDASGRIVRVVHQPSEPHSNHYGIRFLSLPPETEHAIASFVEKKGSSSSRLIP
jgi:response regulator RpfG family c-di-GMP phosphodiesterase